MVVEGGLLHFVFVVFFPSQMVIQVHASTQGNKSKHSTCKQLETTRHTHTHTPCNRLNSDILFLIPLLFSDCFHTHTHTHTQVHAPLLACWTSVFNSLVCKFLALFSYNFYTTICLAREFKTYLSQKCISPTCFFCVVLFYHFQ